MFWLCKLDLIAANPPNQPKKLLDAGYPEIPNQRYFDVFISQSMDTFYITQLLHQAHFTTFTLDTFYTRHLLHQTPVTPDNFYNKQFLHPAPFAPETFYTRHLSHQTPTPLTPDTFYNNLYTKHPLYQSPFTPERLLHQTIFTLDTFYTRHLLHKHPLHHTSFTPNNVYNKQRLQQTTFLPGRFALTHRVSLYIVLCIIYIYIYMLCVAHRVPIFFLLYAAWVRSRAERPSVSYTKVVMGVAWTGHNLQFTKTN